MIFGLRLAALPTLRQGLLLDGFFRENLPLRPVMPTGKHVLEVKYDEFLPDFLYDVMNLGSLRQSAYSKYYLCRKFTK